MKYSPRFGVQVYVTETVSVSPGSWGLSRVIASFFGRTVKRRGVFPSVTLRTMSFSASSSIVVSPGRNGVSVVVVVPFTDFVASSNETSIL